jgi:hypothetical protein
MGEENGSLPIKWEQREFPTEAWDQREFPTESGLVLHGAHPYAEYPQNFLLSPDGMTDCRPTSSVPWGTRTYTMLPPLRVPVKYEEFPESRAFSYSPVGQMSVHSSIGAVALQAPPTINSALSPISSEYSPEPFTEYTSLPSSTEKSVVRSVWRTTSSSVEQSPSNPEPIKCTHPVRMNFVTSKDD